MALLPDGSNAVLRLNPLPTEGATYNVTIANIIDSGYCSQSISSNFIDYDSMVEDNKCCLLNYIPPGGSTLNYLTNSDKYLWNNADAKLYMTTVNLQPNLENYGSRMVFYFIPTNSENYTFYISSTMMR